MRLVCESCRALYTIDDDLVGARDFRVSCKTCGKPIVVRKARQVAVTQRMLPPGASLPPPSQAAVAAAPALRPPTAPARPAAAALAASARVLQIAPDPAREGWYVALDGGGRGPLSAQHIAGMLEQGSMDWSTQVWREGLKGWRAARRDAQLVTAVAGVRGVAGDTTRLDAGRSFVSPGDTFLSQRARADATGLLRRHRPTPSESRPLTPRSLVPGQEPLPDLRPSPPPQAWHSPENAAFRAALGLPADSMQERLPSAPVSSGQVPRSGASSDATQLASLARPRSTSLVVVAAVAFTAGVFTSTLWERLAGRRPAVTDVARAAPALERDEMVLPVQSPPAQAPGEVAQPEAQAESAPAPALTPDVRMPELPTVEQLRAGVRGVTGEVRRCVDDPATGVDVDIYLDGPSGRVRDVDVRSPLIPPARAECIQRAVRSMQVSPFTRPELKLMHKFRW